MVKTKKPKRKNNTTKKRGGSMFGYVTGVDNNLVTLSCNDKSIQCSICNNPQFQFRNGTVGKSKTQAVLFSFVSDETKLNDISINCYFCNNCGNAIFVRDPKTSTTDTIYPNVIKYTAVTIV